MTPSYYDNLDQQPEIDQDKIRKPFHLFRPGLECPKRPENPKLVPPKSRSDVVQYPYLYIGKIDEKKNIINLIKAWVELDVDRLLPKDAILTIHGWSSDDLYFKSCINAAKTCSDL